MYFYKILHIFVAISTFIFILNGSKIDKTLTGLVQNDPLLIKTIQEQFLVKPTSSDKDYNFTAHRYMSLQINMDNICIIIGNSTAFCTCMYL